VQGQELTPASLQTTVFINEFVVCRLLFLRFCSRKVANKRLNEPNVARIFLQINVLGGSDSGSRRQAVASPPHRGISWRRRLACISVRMRA
jgi:hypothetical protein